MTEDQRMRCLELSVAACGGESSDWQTILEAAQQFENYVMGDRLGIDPRTYAATAETAGTVTTYRAPQGPDNLGFVVGVGGGS